MPRLATTAAAAAAARASLLLLVTLLCQPVLSRDLGKLDSIKDVIHTAVRDAVKQHCTSPDQAPAGSRCESLCPEGFTACAGRCYALQLTPVDYEAAERRCAELNSTLAIPRTRAENLCVAGLSGGRRAWLGVTDRHTEGVFLAEDGTPMGELDGHRWADSQPDNYRGVNPTGENCVEMFGGCNFAAWNDVSCASLRLPMCQKWD